jgi:hypothetical protein
MNKPRKITSAIRNYYRRRTTTRNVAMKHNGFWYWCDRLGYGYWVAVSRYVTKDTQITRQREINMKHYKIKKGRMKDTTIHPYPLCKYGVII